MFDSLLREFSLGTVVRRNQDQDGPEPWKRGLYRLSLGATERESPLGPFLGFRTCFQEFQEFSTFRVSGFKLVPTPFSRFRPVSEKSQLFSIPGKNGQNQVFAFRTSLTKLTSFQESGQKLTFLVRTDLDQV